MTADEEQLTRRPAGRVLRLWRRAGPFLSLGVSGQVLTLAAMLVPILLRETEQVLLLVFTSAVAGLLVNPGMLAFPFLFPVIRGPRTARVATVASLGTLAVVSAGALALTPLEGTLGLRPGAFSGAAVLTATWGLYSVVVTRLVRAGDVTGIGLARLYYGLAVLTAALVAGLADLGPLSLTYGTGMAYLAAALALVPRRSHWGPPLRPMGAQARRRLRRAYLRRSVRPSAASLANGWTTLVPGLVLPGLGSAAEPWAIVSRMCGGFATVLMALVAPPLEMRQSRSVRERDAGDYAAARRAGFLLGAGFAVVAVVSGLGMALYATGSGLTAAWFLPVAAATVLYWGSLLAGTLVNRLPSFLGRDGARLAWDAGRAALLTGTLLLVDGTAVLVVMGMVLAVSAVLLVSMTRWRSAG
ncbi:hypothetical protein [Blastococcus sp. CCUG 61487]|uniref:hypothetical protein n=1 Tax=Blastococcus sp. CCUG 61487 TaxID=1840703 RepID=UPI0010C10A43|nr:hypothetical protein [Blastococcus sp. CCUG 61487]TKJ28111.1 hypothetical protein A6V29_03110 [Blastococcus sp. CCUG 61487]